MIAILLSTYNGEKYLDKLLTSLMQQTYQKFFLYIFDDGSTDNTVNIICDWIDRFPDKIKLIKAPPTHNPKINYFNLLESVEADYYMFCDQDDIWCENKVDVYYKTVMKESTNTPLLIHSDLMLIDENDKTINKSYIKQQKIKPKKECFNRMLIQNSITGCTILINKRLRNLALRSTDYENIIMHDWWLGLIANKYGKVVFIDKQLIKYRQHSNNVIGAMPYFDLSTIISNIKKHTYNINFAKTQRQAKEFVMCFDENNDSLALRYSELHKENKIYRILFYFRYKVLKYGALKIIGQILFW